MAIHNGNHRVKSTNLPPAGHHAFLNARLFLSFPDHLFIVRVIHGILRHHIGIKLLEAILIQSNADALRRAHAEMGVAVGAKLIFRHFFFIDNRLAGIALNPHAVWNGGL